MLSSPFGDEELDEVPLPRAPLVSVVAQIRFETASVMANETAGRDIVTQLGREFPAKEETKEQRVLLGGGAPQVSEGSTLWRLTSRDGYTRVTFSDSFMSLDTSRYTSRATFCDTFRMALEPLLAVAEPRSIERAGFRYINQITNESVLGRLEQLVRPELRGIGSVPLPDTISLDVDLAQAAYSVGDGGLQARWGVIPGGVQLDPVIPAADARSWVLDVDTFDAVPDSSTATQLADRVSDLSSRAYRFFRWAVTDNFLAEFGGQR